jgi:ABC-type microcin C transport system permease subunit YejE
MRPLKEARRSACISRSINESKGIEKVRGDMKLHVITKILIFLLIITLSLASYTIAADKPLVISNVDQGYFDEIQKDPRLLINEYCKEVFLGSEDIGIELVKLSLEKAIKEQALAPALSR